MAGPCSLPRAGGEARHRAMQLLALLVVVAGLAAADPQRRPTRHDVLALGRRALSSSSGGAAHLPSSRVVARAAPGSTFARFLAGDTSAPQCGRSDPESPGGSIYPADSGADATGRKDSSDAMDAAVAQAMLRNTSARKMGTPKYDIADLGGVTIDLRGGDYLLSRPIVLPRGYGNIRFAHGSLRADPETFPMSRYLLEISDVNKTECARLGGRGASCNEDISIEDIFFDGSHRAYGCLQISNTMGANVGPNIYVLNFVRAGITVHGGHEAMIHEAWLGANYFGTTNHTLLEAGSTAIEVLGNDHVISDVVIFGGQTGVYTANGANLLTGIHTWNDATHAQSPGHGIVVDGTQSVRVIGCYLDYTALRLVIIHPNPIHLCVVGVLCTNVLGFAYAIYQVDPVHISVVDTFFLGGATLVVAAGEKATVSGLTIMDNTWNQFNKGDWSKGNVTVVVDERNGTFQKVTDVVMLGNVGSSAGRASITTRAVTATQTLTQHTPSTRWDFDFSPFFAFPNLGIVDVQYSIEIGSRAPDASGQAVGAGSFARHASRPPVGQRVAVETDVPVVGTVTLTATQGVFTPGNR